ncbi:MAG: hypothetical protein P8J14_10105 [Emcibacteraceae bacterium]|nr:hypothetical protein [Emcibacteraceae bacterium]
MTDNEKIIKVNNPMQYGYQYSRSAPIGEDFDEGFEPFYTPKEMLEKGVFEGYYLNSAMDEYPSDWRVGAKLSIVPDVNMNFFKIKSRQSLSIWRDKGWIIEFDPRGWFEWYCRYYMGRRHPEMDDIQIKRWRAFRRHAGQIRANCEPGDIWCRPRQRQALLQWSYDPFI